MTPYGWARLRLRALFGRRALEHDMQDEMRAHLEQATERYQARGLPYSEARQAAMREFGNVGSLQEQGRDARGGRWAEELAADVRFAFRYFGRKKLATATIVLVLALGIGANTAIFSVLHAWFFRPAPAVPADPAHAMVHVFEQPAKGAEWEPRGLTYDQVLALAERRQAFASVAAAVSHDVVLNAGDSIGARSVVAEFVTPEYFSTIGVPIYTGTGFARQAPDVPDMAAVMSRALADAFFDDPASAVGRTILINEVPVRIVGIAQPSFQGVLPGMRRELWLPVSARADVARIPPRWLADSASLQTFARLAPGISHEQATTIARSVAAQGLPDSVARLGGARVAYVTKMREQPPIGSDDEAAPAIAVMSTVGLLMLLIACTNVTAMMIASAVGRRQEIAVRLSLGASRWRLLRQLLTESTLLATAGGIIGVALYWSWVRYIASRDSAWQFVDLSPDVSTLAFMMAVALGTGILFGLSPALHATRTGLATALRQSGGGATHRSRLQRFFVGAQIVFSQPLLVLLALMISIVWYEFESVPPSVSEHITTARFLPLEGTGGAMQRQEAVDSLIPRIAAHAEVVAVVPEAAAFTIRNVVAALPDESGEITRRVHLEGAAPGWFAMLDVPILLGRDVSLADTAESDFPVVIGSDLAREVWGDANPIGRTLVSPELQGTSQDSIRLAVIGVYDAAHPTTRGSAVQRVFTAKGMEWRRDMLLVRTHSAAERFVPQLRRLIQSEAPNLPIAALMTLAQVDDIRRRDNWQIGGALAGAAALALFLASLGLYGVVSLAVQQRRREIGIRIAMGARPAEVVRMFLASGVRVGLIALVIGLPVSLVAFQLLVSTGLLIVPKFDPWAIGAAVAAVLLAVASAATWLPARQAARVDPATTLRAE